MFRVINMPFDISNYHDFAINYKDPNTGDRAIGFFPKKRKLKSGRESGWYWNGRIFLHYRGPLDKMANFMLNFVADNDIMPDYFVSVPQGTDKLVDRMNYKLGGKQVQSRKVAKLSHGDKRDAHFIGPVEEGDKVVIVEDVTTTGGSLTNQVAKCRSFGLNVIATICECNRMEKAARGAGTDRHDFDFGVSEYVKRATEGSGEHYALTTADKIVPVAFKRWVPESGQSKADVAKIIRDEYEDHGIIAMDLKV